MATLVLSLPARNGWRSFQETFASGVGEEYAIPGKFFPRLESGRWVVVLLSKDKKLRGEGKLSKIVWSGETTVRGMHRYDVYIKNLKMVPYKSERLLRTGIAVID